MRHFADEEWADLVRDGAAPATRARLLGHLEEGCEPCASKLRTWETVRDWASRERSYEPPEPAVRQARGLYALNPPRRPRRGASLAALVFDSFLSPLPAGVRSGRAVSRQLLYESGGRLVKLRLESVGETDKLSLVGQLVDENRDREISNLPVLVQTGQETVARTLTNRLGEFELELDWAEGLQVVVGVPGPNALTVGLPVSGGRVGKH
jgi:hypothetical protein